MINKIIPIVDPLTELGRLAVAVVNAAAEFGRQSLGLLPGHHHYYRSAPTPPNTAGKGDPRGYEPSFLGASIRARVERKDVSPDALALLSGAIVALENRGQPTGSYLYDCALNLPEGESAAQWGWFLAREMKGWERASAELLCSIRFAAETEEEEARQRGAYDDPDDVEERYAHLALPQKLSARIDAGTRWGSGHLGRSRSDVFADGYSANDRRYVGRSGAHRWSGRAFFLPADVRERHARILQAHRGPANHVLRAEEQARQQGWCDADAAPLPSHRGPLPGSFQPPLVVAGLIRCRDWTSVREGHIFALDFLSAEFGDVHSGRESQALVMKIVDHNGR